VLEALWGFALADGGKVLALTVPEVRFRGLVDERRKEVNRFIREYCRPN
jgi:hypothetical protein